MSRFQQTLTIVSLDSLAAQTESTLPYALPRYVTPLLSSSEKDRETEDLTFKAA